MNRTIAIKLNTPSEYKALAFKRELFTALTVYEWYTDDGFILASQKVKESSWYSNIKISFQRA